MVKGRDAKDLSKALAVELRKEEAYREVEDMLRSYKSVGAEIAKAMEKSGITAKELAARSGKSETVVRRMQRGEYKQYTIKLLLDITRVTKMELHRSR